jgi:Glycosyltransferase family 87
MIDTEHQNGQPADSGPRQRTPLLPWLTLLFLGSAALGLYFLLAPIHGGQRYYKVGVNAGAYLYMRQILLLFVPYALAIVAWRRGARVPLYLLLGGAVVLHLIVLFAPPPQSQDVYQYLFYGRMQAAHGANPYLLRPRTFWADPWFPWAKWHGQTSVYGPLWMFTTWGVAKIAGNSMTLAMIQLKLVILALDLTVMGLLLSQARHGKEGADAAGLGLLMFAWNPLVLISVPLAGSADVAVAAAFIGAVLARRRGRTGLATFLLAVAPLIKVYAIIGLVLHLVLVARERGRREVTKHVLMASFVTIAAYAYYWAGPRTFLGLWKAVGFSNGTLVGLVQRVVGLGLGQLGLWDRPAQQALIVGLRVIGLGLLALAALWAIRKVRDEESYWQATLVVFAAYFYLSPWFLYWYLIGPLALVSILPRNRMTDPLLVFSATSLATIGFRPGIVARTVQTLVRYTPPVAVYYRKKRLPAETRGGAAITFPVPTNATAISRVPATEK